MVNQIEKRKAEIEARFNELKATKLRLIGQAQAIGKAVALIDQEIKQLQGGFKEMCGLLGLDFKEESKKVEERFAGTHFATSDDTSEKH